MARKILRYSLVSILAMVLAGFFLALFSIARQTVGERTPRPLTEAEPPFVLPLDSSKPTAIILMSNAGTDEVSLLITYEVLASSHAMNVFSAAPNKQLS